MASTLKRATGAITTIGKLLCGRYWRRATAATTTVLRRLRHDRRIGLLNGAAAATTIG